MTSNHFRMSSLKQIPPRISSCLAPVLRRLRALTRRDIALLLAAVPALMLLYVLALIPFTPSISDIRKAASEQPAQILSADGKKLTEFKQSNRVWVKLPAISPHVIDALIATEDHRFYAHFGLDWRRTAAAAINTFRGDRQGGSTLTQQLARNVFPEEIGRAPTLNRKLKEAITALKIEAVHSKDDILETYLNTVPFLYNAFGIEMAARTYFDTRADALDVLQSATLVGMLKGNSYYNPVLNPERALERRNLVLAQMVKHHKLSPARFEALKKRPLRINFERQSEEPGPAPHFAQQLRKWLIAWADRHDYNIFSDGLVVVTSLDSRLQNQANLAVARQGAQLQQMANADWNGRSGWRAGNPLVQTFMRESPEYRAARATGLSHEKVMKQLQADATFMQTLRRQKTTIQTGLLAIDPRNGQIKAWVGSRNFAEDAFDHVQQARRQPGSTFKPFVYGEAFRQGRSPNETLIDQALEIAVGAQEIWRPSDEQPPSGKAMSLRDGLVYSKNTLTAQLMQTTGPAKVAKLARAMGIRQSRLEAVPSLALGTSPVSLKEMVAAYGTIANGGDFIDPLLVTRIEDRHGRLLEAFAAAPERALPRQVAYTLLDVMRGVIDRGTGAGIRSRFGIRADVAGKTGTTQEHADGWFILMHPQLVTGAWVGFNDNRVTLSSAYWGQGAHSALPIVGDFVGHALNSRLIDPRIRFEAPDETGLLQRLFSRLKGWFSDLFGAKPHEKKPPPTKPAAATLTPASPQAAPDPLQEKIDQIIAAEHAGEGPAPRTALQPLEKSENSD
jgi:penicillin-binding protein 1A